jgi:hypothetical protein
MLMPPSPKLRSVELLISVVYRRAGGAFIGASVVNDISDPTTLEAMPCMEVMALAADLQLQHIVVASDCMQVVNNLKEEYLDSYNMITAGRSTYLKLCLGMEIGLRILKLTQWHVVSFVYVRSGRQVWLLQPAAEFCIPLTIDQYKGY